MNFSEFKKLIGADPLNKDADTLRARNSAPEFEAAAQEAELFEEKLQSALQVEPPADLLADIKKISRQPVKRKSRVPMALAASLLITIGTIGLIWKQSNQWESVEAYLIDHYSHDGNTQIARATEFVADEDIAKIMARLDAAADTQLSSRIRLIKHCPTPDGRGAHIVVATEQGPMTLIFMPETQVTDGEMVEFEQMHAFLVSLDHGSVAIIGEQSQSVEGLAAMVRKSLRTGLVGA
jgi:hypothetical protein